MVDAVRCAIEVQNGLIERNAGVPEDRRIEFRVGIHLGDVVEESDGDLMGDGVNIAARLEGIASPARSVCPRMPIGRSKGGSIWRSPISARSNSRNRRADPCLFVAGRRPRAGEAGGTGDAPAPTPQKRRLGLAPLAAALAALLIVIAGGAWWFLNANRPASVAAKAPAEAARLSIVVLPFANLSGDPGQDYLVDALTDELPRVSRASAATFVIARNTAMTFKGKPVDAKAIGKDLGVRYALEGSVQPSGDRMRVNAQLIDAESGAHLWAEQFDTPRADLLQTQDAIVTHLAHDRLSTHRGRGRPLKRRPRPTRRRGLGSPMRRGHMEGRMDRQGGGCGIRALRTGLAIDPNNVRALMGSAIKFWLPAALGLSGDPKGDLERADELSPRRSPLIQISLWLTARRAGSFRTRGAPRNPPRIRARARLNPSDGDA